MAKARARTAARKVKDKWKAKEWYKIYTPTTFNKAIIAETLADESTKLLGRVAEATLQDLTGDFKQMHIKLYFKVYEVNGAEANTRFIGHSLTSDYIRRMTRRNHSKISGVFDVNTSDGAMVRVKPFAMTDKRTQTTQEQAMRRIIGEVTTATAAEMTLSQFTKHIVDGQLAARIFKAVRPIYPVRRVEINKSEVRVHPDGLAEEPLTREEPEMPEEEAPAEETEATEEPEELQAEEVAAEASEPEEPRAEEVVTKPKE